MQGIVFDIKKFAVHDGPGIRTTVFLKGCPMKCTWCHNPESKFLNPEPVKGLIQHKKVKWLKRNDGKVGKAVDIKTIIDEIDKDILFFEESGGGVTFSGGEPLMQVDFLVELLRKSKELGIHTTIDTCGYAGFDSFQKVIPFTDLFLYDLKLMDENVHIHYTGVSNKLINENFIKLNKENIQMRIRIPLIPDVTDTVDNLLDLINFIKHNSNIKEVDLLPFNILCTDKYKKMAIDNKFLGVKQQSKKTLEKISNLFIKNGFDVSIGG